MTEQQQKILCDPQTSGGLLVAVTPDGEDEFLRIAEAQGFQLNAIGEIKKPASIKDGYPLIEIK